jgi:hypothetical protein
LELWELQTPVQTLSLFFQEKVKAHPKEGVTQLTGKTVNRASKGEPVGENPGNPIFINLKDK